MSYMALYRKWRPDEFQEVKGQEAIVQTLKNQILHDRIGHAYLFCGTRGTGKTTIAKLFAKTVNCEHPVDGSPCGQCKSCQAIANGSSMNVIEIDAASNNGVDNIREIRDEVQYSPAEGRYKVYIIDEVHMLSKGAFNALLKTLEEPPSYVIFILATTEAHQIPITILSRCQRYDFRRISIDTIADRLQELMDREQIQVEEKAIRYIAKAADGSMRDALSLLDQCIAFHLGETLTYDMVMNVLGAVDFEVFQVLLERIIAMDTLGAIEQINEIIWQGKELYQFVIDFTWYLRNILLLKTTEQGRDRLDLSQDAVASMTSVAEKMDTETIMRYIRVLAEVSNSIRYASQKRVILELAIIKLCKPQMETSYDAMLERIRQLELAVENGVMAATAAPASNHAAKADDEPMSFSPEEELAKRLEPADVEELKEILGRMKEVKARLAVPARHALEMGQINIGENGHTLVLAYSDSPDVAVARAYYESEANLETLRQVMCEMTGKDVQIHFVTRKPGGEKTFEQFDLTKLKIDIEYED